METLSMIPTLISIVSILIALYSIYQLRHGVKTSFTLDIRRLINRIERNKGTFHQTDPAAYKELFDIQDELETVSKKFLSMFNMK
jgi:hypothetical protein